jgi:translocation and assembly module TamB
LPVAIELGDVQVGSLLFNGSEQLKGLQLAAHWTERGCRSTVKLQRDDLNLNFRAVATGDWPLNAAGNLTLSPGPAPWTLALKVDGDLLKTLNLKADSHGYLDGQLSGELQPLAENLPAKVRITAEAFKPSADLPDTLQLNQLVSPAKAT